jgi:type I restriction enzyme, S subunit
VDVSEAISAGGSLSRYSLDASLGEVPIGYCRTDIGMIPEDWECRPLGELTTRVGSGITPTGGARVYTQEGRPFLRSQNIGWGVLKLEDLAYIADEIHSTFRASEIRDGDVLLNITGASIGRSAVADARVIMGNVNQHVCGIRTDLGLLDPTFLNAYLLSESGQKQIYSFQAGGNRQGLNYNQIRSFLIPLPPITEQHAIAEALSHVDELLGALEALIAKKRAVKQGTMQQLLNGTSRLSGFSGDWETISLGKLFEFKNGLNKSKRFFGHGTPIVNYMDVFNYSTLKPSMLEGRVQLTRQEIQNFDVRKGDVFFTRTSETTNEIGIAAVMIEDAPDTVFSGFVLRARPIASRMYNRFKAYCFASKSVRDQIVATASYTTRALTNGKLLSQVLITLPPEAEQVAISQILSDMDTEIAALEARRDKTRAIKQGMMQQLLTGRIRLVKPQPAEAEA